MPLAESLIVLVLVIVLVGFYLLSRQLTIRSLPDQSQTVIVLIVFAIFAFAAMATQYARIAVRQVPASTSSRR